MLRRHGYSDVMTSHGASIHDDSLVDPLPASPFALLARWLDEAKAAASVRNHDAIALATVDEAGAPQVRMVLARAFDFEAGSFSFYTNRDSPKGVQLDRSGRASGAIYWDALARQVRFSGRVERTSEADSDGYFATRHPQSQLAAWASAQSRPVRSREVLEAQLEEVADRFGGRDAIQGVTRPPNWGGYRLRVDRIELWVERPGRLHDRARWTRSLEGRSGEASGASWKVERLQP